MKLFNCNYEDSEPFIINLKLDEDGEIKRIVSTE